MREYRRVQVIENPYSSMFYEVLSKVLRLLGHFITTDEEKSLALTLSNTNQKLAKTFSEIQDKKLQFYLKKG